MKRFSRIMIIFFLVYLTFVTVSVVEAVDGGQVNTRLGITFEETSPSEDSSTSSSSSAESASGQSAATHSQDKPQGKFPKTGEGTNNFVFLSIALFLLFLSVLIIKKKGEKHK